MCRPDPDTEMDEMINVGSHSLHIRCIGTGRPVVVIDTGWGDTSDKWYPLQEQIAQKTRVCTYDRAGYGPSELGPMPRMPKQVATELRLLLGNAGLEGPYVLVGHSFGGSNAQVFAGLYPDLVAGLVLLDPAPIDFITGKAFPELHQMAEQMTVELKQGAELARQATDPEVQAQAAFYETLASEHAMFFSKGAQQVAALDSFGDIPLVVVAAGKPNPAFGDVADAFQEFWIEQNRDLAQKSANGSFLLTGESTHHLYKDAPELVLEAIHKVVDQVS